MPATDSPPESFCPRCFGPWGEDGCEPCGLRLLRSGGVLDAIGTDERERRAAEVEEFYTASPFPGYAPGDDGPALLDRCRATPFLSSLDAAVAPEARVLDAGCGTAQIAAFLALSGPRRRVVGVDGCRESLACGDAFRTRARIANLQLVRGDLFDLPVGQDAFDVVVSRGVVHHTPAPDEAIARVAACVAPGGVLVLGFYETLGRAFHCLRRTLSRPFGTPIAWLDPVLRRRDLDPEKKRIWIEDQYRHPLEHILPLPAVLARLRELGFRWIRTVPPAARGTSLFEPTVEPGAAGLAALRTGWALRGVGDPDAGLVCVVARRQARS